jgi:predicted nucleotidyltransferase
MNALTNAVNSLGVGETTKEYKDRVFEFVELGNDVVDAVLNKTTPNKEPIIDNTIVDDIDEDLGF